MDKVSVCIPTYNNELTIKDTINSIIAQSYTNLEIIISDDASVDNTVQIIKEFKDKRIKLFINKTNFGMPENWNQSIKYAKGKYIKLICADDILMPNAIREEIKAFSNNPKAELVVSNTNLIDENNQIIGHYHRWPKQGLNNGKILARLSLLINNFFGAPCNALFKQKTAIKSGLFNCKFKLIPDFEMWTKLAIQGDVVIINKYLNSFKIRKNSNTDKFISNKDFRFRYNKEHKNLIEKYSNELKISYYEKIISLTFRIIKNHLIKKYISYKKI